MTPRDRIAAFIGIIGDAEEIVTDAETAGVVAEVVRSLGRDIEVRAHPWIKTGEVIALNRFAHVDVWTGGPASG